MDASRRSTMLGLTLIAGALALAILQVGWVMVADDPQERATDELKFRFETQARAPDDIGRAWRGEPRRPYPRS